VKPKRFGIDAANMVCMDLKGTTWDVRGKTVLITGANSGIGKATAIELARRGACVVITARDMVKGREAKVEIEASSGAPVVLRELDLASFRSILQFASAFMSEYPTLHVLVHNAGLILSTRGETEDGFESTFGINHLGTFFLNRLLLPLLVKSAPSRIVVVASDAHKSARGGLDFDDLQSKRSYNGIRAYAQSKLANVLFARHLATRLAGRGVSAFCLHPGVVATNFTGDGDAGGLWGFFFKWLRPLLLSPEKGARTSVHLCCTPGIEDISGGYFVKCRLATPSKAASDDAAALQLWEISDALCEESALPSFDF
jgi:NAD(P)-dependent dehydrogenase (short-subunit alcohol dehydrogenase family)